jgi:hypothetical protein
MTNLLLLIIIIVLFIYKITGLYYVIPFVISMINIIVTTHLIENDPENMIYRLVNFVSVIIQFTIIAINIIILFNLVIPFL